MIDAWLFRTAPGDYGAVVNAPLDFHVGEELNTTSCVDIDIFDDDTVEYEELFSVSLMTTDPVIIVPISEANVSIFDNDGKSFDVLNYEMSLLRDFHSRIK